MNQIRRRAVLTVGAALLAVGAANASCVAMKPLRLLEAEVVACATAGEVAQQRPPKGHGAPGSAAEAERAADALVAREPGRVLTLELRRARNLGDQPGVAELEEIGPWVTAEKVEPKQYFVRGSAGCGDVQPGEVELFVEVFTCCDTIPAAEMGCFLRLPVLEPPSKELVAKVRGGERG